jgi:REP element-mobilizing transposase RayT
MKYNPDLHHRRSIRLQGYDYANAGAYFVTICCKNRKCLFGKIVSGKMILNEHGEIATQHWHSIPQHFSYAILHKYIVMPNHLHGIIEIKNDAATIGNTVVGALHATPPQSPPQYKKTFPHNLAMKNEYMATISPKCATLSVIIRSYKSSVSKQIHDRINDHTPIWQRNYWEHIIRDEIEYAKISNYIENNPILWENDRFNAGKGKS